MRKRRGGVRPGISIVAEGNLDAAVARHVAELTGFRIQATYVKGGKPALLEKLRGYNEAARHTRWLVVVDLDRDADCAPPFRDDVLSDPAPWMCFRIAVREIEAWLMADRSGFAKSLRVSTALVPRDPDREEDPKRTVVNLARRSRARDIRDDMVPGRESGRDVGQGYDGRLIEFAISRWNVDRANKTSESFARCRKRLAELAEKTVPHEGDGGR